MGYPLTKPFNWFLMRLLKTSGGMTPIRGITDSTLARWVHSLPGVCLSAMHWSLSRQFIQEYRTNTGTSVQRVSQRAYLISMSLFSGKWTTMHINCVIREPDILFPLLLALRQMVQSCDDALHIGQCSMKNMTKSIFRSDSTSERQSQITSC